MAILEALLSSSILCIKVAAVYRCKPAMHTLGINAQLHCNVLGSALVPAEDTTLVPRA